MSNFKGAEICEIESVEKHPNADSLDIVKLKGKNYTCITQSSRQWKPGNGCVYIPEQAVVPDTILERIGLKGKLAGSQGNRVKAIKLRGIISQGLVLNFNEVFGSVENTFFEIGKDFSEQLGIYKYEPPIPVSMRGEVLNLLGKTVKYDIENIKNHPDIFDEGEEVVITEKIHGTFVCFGYDPHLDNPECYMNKVIIHSKGLGAKGLAFKWNKQNENLVYHRAFKKIEKHIFDFINDANPPDPVFFCAEVYGNGVQDLQYNEKDVNVRVFDVYVKTSFLDYESKKWIFDIYDFPRVPVLYKGPYSKDLVDFYTNEYNNGKETVSGKGVNVREGIVIYPVSEQQHPEIGRKILKSVSEKYLTRKSGTEYN